MSDQPDISKELIRQSAEKYSETLTLRALVQLIPYIGGPLDTLIGGEGQKIQQRRIALFIEELDRRLKSIEVPQNVLANEELFDLMVGTFERVVKTRSLEKQARFAQIIANEIAHPKGIDEVETAIRLIGELDDIHILILDAILHAPLAPAPYEGSTFVTVSKHIPFPGDANHTYLILTKEFPAIPEHILRLTCSELVSKGLIFDDGVGKFSGTAMEQFAATNLSIWLFAWLESN
jgi:hypothetical protein